MSSRDNLSDEAKLAKILVPLVVAICGVLWEFVLNPGNNYTVEVRGSEVVVVDGVGCYSDPASWQFTILETWYRSKKYYAKLLTWVDSGETESSIGEMEVRSRSNLMLPSCNGEETDVAYIWSISSNELYMHLRVHPDFNVYVDPTQQIPR